MTALRQDPGASTFDLSLNSDRAGWAVLPTVPNDHDDFDVLRSADELCVQLLDLAVKPDVRPAFERRLREYVDEIGELAALMLRRRHRIAFVGSIGIGKSTAICRLTGMELPATAGRQRSVLETGGGGITLCEVHLVAGEGYAVRIDPRSFDEIRADVADFAVQLLRGKDAAAVPDQPEDAVRALPREVERALRNMSDLRSSKSKCPDGSTVRVDPARALADEVQDERELTAKILSRMELHRRDRREERYDIAQSVAPLEWLKRTFEAVNNGRHADFSFPARVELVVPTVLDIPGLEIDIVDTRGIDQLTAREDLEAHLADSHTVTVLCSGFNDAPEQAIHHLLNRGREIENPQLDSHVALLVLARPEEALAVKDDSGLMAESAAEGYELKGEQVATALSPYGLSALPVAFFNAIEDDIEPLREFLIKRVVATRAGVRDDLKGVLLNARVLLDNVEEQQVLEVQRAAGRHVAAWLGQHRVPVRASGHIQDALLSEIRSAHASTVRAAVRRDGEWRSLSYSHQLGFGARRHAVSSLTDFVTRLKELCDTLSESSPEAEELLTQAARLGAHGYEELLKRMQLAGQTLYREQLMQDQALWAKLRAEWGSGAGYRNRVAGTQADWFMLEPRTDIDVEVTGRLSREWNKLLDRIGSIFDAY